MTPFPPEPPIDPDDLVSVADNDWRAFCRLPRMTTHWDRPGWTRGRRSYHWMLTFSGCGELHERVRQCQHHLPPAVLDPVEPGALHVTLGRVGFTDEITRVEAEATACHIPALPSAFPLEVGPITGSRGAVRFSLAPWTPVTTLHAGLTTSARSVLGDRCAMGGTADLRPHLSIAYANTTVAVDQVAALLRPLRGLPRYEVQVRSVVLVELRRSGRSYVYDELVRVPLPGSASAR